MVANFALLPKAKDRTLPEGLGMKSKLGNLVGWLFRWAINAKLVPAFYLYLRRSHPLPLRH